MNVKIGKQNLVLNSNYIRSFESKDEFIEKTLETHSHIKAGKDAFRKALSDVYNAVVPKKKKDVVP